MKVIRLVGQHTVEEIILRRAEQKLHLTHNVMSSRTVDVDDNSDDDDHQLKVDSLGHCVTA